MGAGAAGVLNRDLVGKGRGGVEVRLDETPRVMLVRGGEGKGAAGVGEGVLRRVGFELGEWVRGKEEERGG